MSGEPFFKAQIAIEIWILLILNGNSDDYPIQPISSELKFKTINKCSVSVWVYYCKTLYIILSDYFY